MPRPQTAANQYLDAFLGDGGSFQVATHMGLLTAASVTAYTECTTPGTNGYDRIAIDALEFSAAAAGVKTNTVEQETGPATTDIVSGTDRILFLGFFDAATGGNLLGYIPTPAGMERTWLNLQRYTIAVGDIRLRA